MEYTRGRIVLTYYLRFPLMGIGLYFLGLVVMGLFSDESLLYELRVARILPLIIIFYFALFPLSLLIGFWMGSGYIADNPKQFIKDSWMKGFLVSVIYGFFLLLLDYIYRVDSSFISLIIRTIGGGLIGCLFSYLIARSIIHKGVERLKKDF